MALITFSGMASGIDSTSLIKAMLDQERKTRVDPFQTKIAAFQDTNSSLDELSSLLTKLQTAAAKFRSLNGSLLQKNASSTDETVLTASASNSASNGTYALSVSAVAKNATYSFQSSDFTYSSASAVVNSSINNGAAEADRTVSLTVGTGGDAETVDIVMTDSTTLDEFVTQFNNSSTKAVASVVNVGNSSSPDYRIAIVSNSQGTAEGNISVNVGSAITSGASSAFDTNSVSQATDATFSISGISGTITRSSNSVSDVIPGMTFNLQSTGSASLSISDDVSASSTTVQEFVDAYNEVVNYIAENDLITRQEENGEVSNIFGPLADTSIDENILGSLRSALTGSATSGRTVNMLADIGITTQRDGTLAFDNDTFVEAMSNDSEGVRQITQTLGETLAATDGTIAQYTRFNGMIDQLSYSNSQSISDMQNKVADAEKSLAKQEQSLTAQFSRLEYLMSKLNSQSQTLQSILP